jgi:hypothetical protein
MRRFNSQRRRANPASSAELVIPVTNPNRRPRETYSIMPANPINAKISDDGAGV